MLGLKLNSSPSSSVHPLFFQTLSSLLDLNQNRSKLKLYISHLTSLCQERDPITLQDFSPPPAYHRSDSASWHVQLRSMTQEQVSVCLVMPVLSVQILVRVREQNTVNPAGFWQRGGGGFDIIEEIYSGGSPDDKLLAVAQLHLSGVLLKRE